MEKPRYLILENGRMFEGRAFGADAETTGELVFTTSMTGYLETLTDPSYYGQMVVQTFPLIGNYGVIREDFESRKLYPKAYIVREWCERPSNFRCEGELDALLRDAGVVGICDVDTRELTKLIREYGVMNAKLTDSLESVNLEGIRRYRITDAVEHVTCSGMDCVKAEPSAFKVVLWDFGAKENIRRSLVARGCDVITIPADTTAEKIAALEPDGVMLSNGPGDPADNSAVIDELAALCRKRIPVFGICLGHQLLALSQGARTTKLKYGHRGANQPVKDHETGRVYITSQNHGYAVLTDSLPEGASPAFSNANDGTNEGIRYGYMPAFSVQFHPEACGGPHDTSFLFDRFLAMMKEAK